ncbi:hypothetical protein BX600DRAFT_467287 [Xylariales sp. PMI_506]|nr:hypothetical protein BX600DRAFT_467287 [Xylariales sp. PMI_506]
MSAPTGLLALPRELRDSIYAFCLVEPPRLDRRHGALCYYSPTKPRESEEPPFVTNSTRDGGVSNLICQCAKRRGLTLLLANRQVFEEASPLFWSRNVLSFRDLEDFYDCVGTRLRVHYRNLLHRVSILAYGHQRHVSKKMGILAWSILLECKSLRTLDTHKSCLTPYGSVLRQLKDEFADRCSINVCRIVPYTYSDLKYYFSLVYVRASLPLPLDTVTTWQGMDEFSTAYDFDFQTQVDDAIRRELLDSPNSNQAVPLVAQKFSDVKNRYSLSLEDGTVAKVVMYGLPLSKESRLKHHRARSSEPVKKYIRVLPSLAYEGDDPIIAPRNRGKKYKAKRSRDKQRRTEETRRRISAIAWSRRDKYGLQAIEREGFIVL